MVRGRSFALFLVLSLLANAFCLPTKIPLRKRRDLNDSSDKSDSSLVNDIDTTNNESRKDNDITTLSTEDLDDDDFDDDFKSPPASGGSNIFSLLNIATALLPSLSGNNNVSKNHEFVTKMIRDIIKRYQKTRVIQKRQDIGDNVIDIDYATELKPPVFERQESEEDDDNDSDASNGSSEDSDEDNGAEESVELASTENSGTNSKQDDASNASNNNGDSDASDNDSDYDEPEGDGQGGGILGLLAGLSGDGESDLGSLLATVGGIIANLSGDGVDINAIIATGLGLFVGLLSDEGSNPGEIIASYLQTSLDTITGGGAQNNGAFFGKFLSSLVKGVSAAEDSGSGSSEENGRPPKADSGGFFASLLMGLLGDMSKHSSGSWR